MISNVLRLFGAAIAIGCLMTPAVFGDHLTATIDGDTSEWAAVPVFATDAVDNAGSIDFTSIQIANDENFIYVRYVVNESISSANFSGVFKSVDEDVDVATGFDVFSLGVVGAESSWQGDFPFENATGVYNTGNGLTSAVNLASSLQTSAGTLDVEFAIDRSTIHTVGGANVFPADGDQIAFALFTDQGAGDLIGGGAYTLAAPPAPPSDFLTATIDGDTSEWAGVPVFATDAVDNAGSIDFTSIQIANDENFIYVRYLVNEPISFVDDFSGVFKSVDEDVDVTTGFDVFSLGVVGAESSWQGDFPFENATGVYNTGNGLTSAVDLMSSLQASAGTLDVEFAIDRSTIHTVGGANVFPADGDQIAFALWTDRGAGDLIGGGAYTLAASSVLLGDVDLSGTVDFLDIAPFIALLSMGSFQVEADINTSGNVDFLDIAPFIVILSTP